MSKAVYENFNLETAVVPLVVGHSRISVDGSTADWRIKKDTHLNKLYPIGKFCIKLHFCLVKILHVSLPSTFHSKNKTGVQLTWTVIDVWCRAASTLRDSAHPHTSTLSYC